MQEDTDRRAQAEQAARRHSEVFCRHREDPEEEQITEDPAAPEREVWVKAERAPTVAAVEDIRQAETAAHTEEAAAAEARAETAAPMEVAAEAETRAEAAAHTEETARRGTPREARERIQRRFISNTRAQAPEEQTAVAAEDTEETAGPAEAAAEAAAMAGTAGTA